MISGDRLAIPAQHFQSRRMYARELRVCPQISPRAVAPSLTPLLTGLYSLDLTLSGA